MSDLFYRAFEEKFRGSRSLIRSRLDVYRNFVSPLNKICSDARGLDLGCGRGEWLEVLQEEGIEPLGIDLDEGMLEACRALHLPAVKGDAVAYLAALPNESQAIISAFHMVEHIPFDQLQVIVSESLRVLKPGGLLIMETPNPENITVATRDFYLDPTHQRPIPPLLLSFLPEYYGFQRSKILRLQQSARLEQDTDPSLIDVLEGASPDYAVIAQKTATHAHLAVFDAAFGKEYGLPLHVLASRHDAAFIGKAQHSENKALQAEAKAQHAENKALQAEAKAQQAEDKAHRAEITAQQTAALASEAGTVRALLEQQLAEIAAQKTAALASEAGTVRALLEQQLAKTEQDLQRSHHRAIVAEQQVHAMLNSTSWRITAPLRGLRTMLASLLRLPLRLLRACIRPFMLAVMRFVIARPRLANRLAALLSDYPWLHTRLRLFAIHRGVIEQAESQPLSTNAQAVEVPPGLTPHAHRIFDQLKTAIKNDRIRE